MVNWTCKRLRQNKANLLRTDRKRYRRLERPVQPLVQIAARNEPNVPQAGETIAKAKGLDDATHPGTGAPNKANSRTDGNVLP